MRTNPINPQFTYSDCTWIVQMGAIEWNATEMRQLWEQCNLGSIGPINGQSIENWGFQLRFAITTDCRVWALTRGQAQTDAWGFFTILSVPHDPQNTLSWVVTILMQSTMSSFAIHPIASQFRIFAILLQFRQIALRLNPDPKMSTRFQAPSIATHSGADHCNADPIFYNHEDWWRTVQFQGIPWQSSNPCAIH